jgi:hypothetical protein
MIIDFKKWNLLESFGNGEETFTEKLYTTGVNRNLDIDHLPSEWGDELYGATGTLTFKVELDVKQGGIEDIYFTIERLDLELEIIKYDESDPDSDGESIIKEFSVTKEEIGENLTVNIHNLPFYMSNLEVSFYNAENNDGEIDMDKVRYTMDIGNVKD